MRPKQHKMLGSSDLFRARLDQIINLKHELVQLAGAIDWEWLDAEIAPLFSAKGRRAMELLLAESLPIAHQAGALRSKGLARVTVCPPGHCPRRLIPCPSDVSDIDGLERPHPSPVAST